MITAHRLICIWFICSSPILAFGQSVENKPRADSYHIEKAIQNAWSNACKIEPNKDLRFSKFKDFLELLLGVRVPDWGQRGVPVWMENYEALDERVSETERLKIFCHDAQETTITLFDMNDAKIWEIPSQDLFPRLISGPALLHVKLVVSDENFYAFGNLGPALFVQGISRRDGKIIFHYAFFKDSDRGNVGRNETNR